MEEVLDHISKELTEKESKTILINLGINDDDPQREFADKLKDIPWFDLKEELELEGRNDIVKYVKKNTLITRGKCLGLLDCFKPALKESVFDFIVFY